MEYCDLVELNFDEKYCRNEYLISWLKVFYEKFCFVELYIYYIIVNYFKKWLKIWRRENDNG